MAHGVDGGMRQKAGENPRQAHEGAQVRLNGTTTGVLVSAGIPAGTLPGQDGSPPGRRR